MLDAIKTKDDIPELIAVTIPLLSICEICGALLIHIPPEDGVNVVVVPTQIVSDPII